MEVTGGERPTAGTAAVYAMYGVETQGVGRCLHRVNVPGSENVVSTVPRRGAEHDTPVTTRYGESSAAIDGTFDA